jgi:hypothetical protein
MPSGACILSLEWGWNVISTLVCHKRPLNGWRSLCLSCNQIRTSAGTSPLSLLFFAPHLAFVHGITVDALAL